MAEENEAAQGDKKKGSALLLAMLVGVVGMALGGGGVFFALSREGTGSPSPSTTEAGAPEGGAAPVSFQERVHSLDPFVVNVSGEGYPRYVKLQLAFELDSLTSREEFEQRIAQVRDLTILLLSSKRLEDFDGFEGKALLKDDLRDRVNAILTTGNVESVMFTEFVIQ